MSKIALLVVVMYISGLFFTPLYSYTSSEKARLIRQPTFADNVLWPVRAYNNWSMCGSIGYCEKARCATLRGGCQGLGTIKNKPLTINESDKPFIMKGPDPSFGQIGEVRNNSRSSDKYNPEAHRKFQKMTEKKNSVNSANEPQRKTIQDKLKKVDKEWKGLNLGEPKKQYRIEELPELQKSIEKKNSVNGRSAQDSKTADQKSKIPWAPLTDFRDWPQKRTPPQNPKAAKQKKDPGPAKPKRGLDLKTFRNNSFGAYTKALKEGKYTIIQFGSDYCGFCKNMIKKLGDDVFAKYADRVVVSETDSDLDEGARMLAEALGVVRYPTLVILETNSKNIHVAGRIEGEVPVVEIDRIFQKAMKEPIGK